MSRKTNGSMATLIRANGQTEIVRPKNNKKFSLEELQGFVGGYIEVVNTNGKTVMYVDEEGKLKGKPINSVATRLMHQSYVDMGDCVVGDALLIGELSVDSRSK